MTVELVKYSSPGWEKSFATMEEAVTELRQHICESCLLGKPEYVDENGNPVEDDGLDDPDVDVIHNGVRYECRDPLILLGTSCGCEYGMDGDVPWLDDFESGNAEWAASFAA